MFHILITNLHFGDEVSHKNLLRFSRFDVMKFPHFKGSEDQTPFYHLTYLNVNCTLILDFEEKCNERVNQILSGYLNWPTHFTKILRKFLGLNLPQSELK